METFDYAEGVDADHDDSNEADSEQGHEPAPETRSLSVHAGHQSRITLQVKTALPWPVASLNYGSSRRRYFFLGSSAGLTYVTPHGPVPLS